MKAIKAFAIVDKNGNIGRWVSDNHILLFMTSDDRNELVTAKHPTDKIIRVEIREVKGGK
jgi:hypothetical protein